MTKIRKHLIIIVFFAILVRLAYVLMYPQISLLNDPAGYDRTGWGLVNGKGFPLFKINNEVIISRPPGYPIFLATVYRLFGYNYQSVRIIQAILDSLTCLIIFYIGAKTFNISLGYISAICYAFYFPPIIYTGLLYTESLYTLILSLSILFLLFAIKHDRIKYWIGSGVFLGLATLISTRSLFMPLFIFGVIFLNIRSIKKSLKRVSIIILCMLILFSPWTIRNYLVTGKFILLDNIGSNGISLIWLATNPYGVVDWNMAKEPIKSRFGNLTEEERVKIFQKEAWKNLKQYPLTYLKNSVKRFCMFWLSSYSYHIYGFEKSFFSSWQEKDWNVLLFKLFLLGINTIFVIFGFLGLWFSRYIWKQEYLVIIAPILYSTIVDTFYVVTPRHQVPIIPYMMIFTMVGIASVFRLHQLTPDVKK